MATVGPHGRQQQACGSCHQACDAGNGKTGDRTRQIEYIGYGNDPLQLITTQIQLIYDSGPKTWVINALHSDFLRPIYASNTTQIDSKYASGV